MPITEEEKKIIMRLICERAYEISEILSEDDYFNAKMCGLTPDQVQDVSIECAIRELQKEFNQ